MTYRERRLARAQRLSGWAETRKTRAAAALKAGERYRGDTAFNTQPGHIPERARLIAREDAAHQSLATARRMDSRAAEIERQADRAIYRDDPDAVERVTEKLAGLEAKRTKMKAENAAYRKGDAAYAALLGITLEQAAARRAAIEGGACSWDRKPYPAFELQNLGGTITKERKRLAEFTSARAQRMASLAPFKVGDRVLVDTHSNLGIVPCTVRDVFLQVTLMEPTPTPAVLLNELSWAYVRDCEAVPDGE